MTIATLLFVTFVMKISGDTGSHGMVGAILIGTVICIITAVSCDTSQDLKTGNQESRRMKPELECCSARV